MLHRENNTIHTTTSQSSHHISQYNSLMYSHHPLGQPIMHIHVHIYPLHQQYYQQHQQYYQQHYQPPSNTTPHPQPQPSSSSSSSSITQSKQYENIQNSNTEQTNTNDLNNFERKIFENLTRYRKENIPVWYYRILTSDTIIRICKQRPTTKEVLRSISGVGPTTIDKYGDDILDICNSSLPEV